MAGMGEVVVCTCGVANDPYQLHTESCPAYAVAHRLRMPCGFAAPLVVNGAAFVGCQLEKGHDGQHSITLKWGD